MYKMKFADRLALFFGALIVIVSGAALIVAGLQITGFMVDALPTWARAVSIGLGVLCVFFGGYLLAFPRKFRAGRHDFVVQRTDNGELRISVKAIEGLVQKCIDMHDEIRVNSQRIHNTRDGVVVDLNIALANNISIPLAVAALQKQIKQYLSASSGIDVTEVRVSVDTAQLPMKNGKAARRLHPRRKRRPKPPSPPWKSLPRPRSCRCISVFSGGPKPPPTCPSLLSPKKWRRKKRRKKRRRKSPRRKRRPPKRKRSPKRRKRKQPPLRRRPR